MMRLPIPAEPGPPPEPLVTLRVRLRDGAIVTYPGLPASAAHALAAWPLDEWASTWIVYPTGVSDLFGQSA